jgi:subfamily B ATP-binding cassette protein MsbA
MNVVAQAAMREVKDRLYAKLQDLSLDFYSKKRAGELISRITTDVGFIANAISFGLSDVILHSMQLVVFTFMTLYLRWDLTLIALGTAPFFIWPVVSIGKRVKKLSRATQEKMADLNTLLAETIQGAYIVKVFCREDYELKRFKDINYHYYKFNLSSVKRMTFLTPFTEFAGSIGAIAILWIVGKDVISGVMSFGFFAVYMAALLQMMKPFKKLSAAHVINQQAIAASNRIYDILNEEPRIKEMGNAKDIREFKEKITFENVWFKYDSDYVLSEINLEVKRGETIAIVGYSGAGKTSLVGLLPRLYDPQRGRILIDGVDTKEFKLKPLRSMIAVVSQEMVLFNSTVRDNIGYGREGASEAEIIEAAKKAYAYDFIEKLPRGFDTVIGDRGFRLSGGERQRVAIARAILKDAPILILDEATSSLDSKSEKVVQEAFYNLLAGNRTAFIIAHRLSTVQKADKILVLDKGRIVEAGSHALLLSGDTLYKKLHEMQFRA